MPFKAYQLDHLYVYKTNWLSRLQKYLLSIEFPGLLEIFLQSYSRELFFANSTF